VRDLRFARLEAGDLLEIQQQRSPRVLFGMPATTSLEDAEVIASQRVAWTARHAGRLIACFGIVEHFARVHGLAWAMLADSIGAAHLPLTRFVAAAIARCGLARLELLARAPDLERVLATRPGLDSGQIVALARAYPTPEMRWALMLGMTPAHVLRFYGGAAESFCLFERLDPAALLREAA
jgi:hypothetical protein